MKKQNLTGPLLLTLLSLFLFTACVKDKCVRTFTSYTPVYKTKNEVRANVKSNAPKPITQAGKLFLKGKYILLNEVNKGIHIIDNSNPANPQNVSFIDIPGNVDLAVKGNTLYADLYSDLLVIDITDIRQVQLKKVMPNVFPYRTYVSGFLGDTSKIIVDWAKSEMTLNCAEDIRPCTQCAYTMLSASMDANKALAPAQIGGSMARFAISGSMLYTVSDQELNAISIDSPHEPVFTKKKNIGWGIETIFPFKNNLFIGSTTGMFIFSLADPSSPSLVGQFSHARRCDPVIADNNYAFVTLREGTNCGPGNSNQLDVLNITNLSSPSLIRTYNLTNPHGLSKDDNLLFICDGRDGLKIYDATDVADLKLKKHFSGFESFDVIAYNDLAIVVEKTGIRQYDYSNPEAITFLSKINWQPRK